MTLLAVVGYIVLAVGIVLTVIAARQQTTANASEIKIVGVEVKVPQSIVVAILGLVMVLVASFGQAIVDSVTGNKPPADATASAPPTPTVVTTAPAAPQLTVAEPTPGATVTDKPFFVSGTSGLSPSDALWVISQRASGTDQSYQPQRTPCTINAGGAFTCSQEYVGGPADSGQKFTLLFVLATPTGSQALIDYDRSNPAARGYPGLLDLPAGSTSLATVSVQRR